MAPPNLMPLNTGAANSGAPSLFLDTVSCIFPGTMGTMEETMAHENAWELWETESDEEEDLPIRTTYTQPLSYLDGFEKTAGKPAVKGTGQLDVKGIGQSAAKWNGQTAVKETGQAAVEDGPDEPNDSSSTSRSSGSSSDDSLIDEKPSELRLDELNVFVGDLALASVKLRGYQDVSPLHFWLQGFGRGNPIHDYFKSMSVDELHQHADDRKIHAALKILVSDLDEPDRRQKAIVAVQKHHADVMIGKMFNALRDATPEEFNIYEPEDYQRASRRIQQWLRWQTRAVRRHDLPPGGPQSQEPLKLDKMMHDRFDKEEPSTFRHRYEVHANEPQITPTHGSLLWGPGGSISLPVRPLWYLNNKKGIPVRLPSITRVWDSTEDSTKLTRKMPDYPMLFTPEEDGDGQYYRDQSRHRRGAVAVPKSTPPVPTFDRTLNTWNSASKGPGEVSQRPTPWQAPGIAAPSIYPASFKAGLQKMRQTGPPCGPPRHQHQHDGWGLPLSGLRKRKLNQITLEVVQGPKRVKPNVNPRATSSHPSPKTQFDSPGPATMSVEEQRDAKDDALLKMQHWQWPEKNPEHSSSQSSGDEGDDENDDEDDDKDDNEKNIEDAIDGDTDSSAQPQDSTSDNEKDASKNPENNHQGGCQESAAFPPNSRPDDDDDDSKDPDERQGLVPSFTQPHFSGTLGLRGGGNTGGGLFGAANSSNAPATTQAGGGLFGGNTTTPSAPATGTSVFGSGLGSSQPPPATTAAGSSLFGNGGLSLGTPNSGTGTSLFGNNTSTTQPPAASTSGGMFGGGATTANQQANTGSGLFGNSTQTSQVQQTVPAVRVDASNIKPTTRFSELHEDIQQQILAIDEIIQASIEKSLQCSQVMPQLGASVEALPGDVELLETKLETVDGALSRDAQAVGARKEVINADALDALKVFRAVENLKLPAQFHYSSIGGGFNSGSGAGGDEEGSTDLLPYFNSTAKKLEKEINEYQRVVVEVESHLRTVESSAVEGIQKVVRRRQMMGASNGQNGTSGQVDARKEGLRELAGTMRVFEEAVLRVAGRVGEAREGVVELGMGISKR